MDNNLEIYHYVQDEYLSPIVSGHKVNQKERQNLTKDFLSVLKIADKSDNNATRQNTLFLWALALKLIGTF